LSPDDAIQIARFLATVVGRAHARQMEKKQQSSWQKELQRHRSKTLDAPSWLWTCVVDLMTIHEASYLEHCRKIALGAERRRN
jgi:uncharacterized protein (DUF2252 family)